MWLRRIAIALIAAWAGCGALLVFAIFADGIDPPAGKAFFNNWIMLALGAGYLSLPLALGLVTAAIMGWLYLRRVGLSRWRWLLAWFASVGGAIVGGALGGIIGGAVGRGPGGAIAGAAIGAATGAIIASEAQRRNGGYYWWHGGCYYQYPNGAWAQVGYNYCGY